tara:strand:+ start:792 stop:908 length:117 start_codon:yes stop_codon:yes gene_type:complete
MLLAVLGVDKWIARKIASREIIMPQSPQSPKQQNGQAI